MMRAGKYYVGDLCYVMNDVWDEVVDLIFTEDGRPLNGEFNLKDGRRFAIYTTAYGDGTYYDGEGGRYFVDAGVIGCIAMDNIDTSNERNDVDGGNVIVFKEDFNTSSDGENITIGNVTILTGDYDEDPAEEEEYEYEDA
jgi:hypothetical protein